MRMLKSKVDSGMAHAMVYVTIQVDQTSIGFDSMTPDEAKSLAGQFRDIANDIEREADIVNMYS
jgi:hypothetical protein